MVNETAKQRAERAMRARSRKTAEEFDFKTGDLVDIFRDQNKNLSGWRGPARITDCTPETLEGGKIHVDWNGRNIAAQIKDVRRHVVMLVFLMSGVAQWDLVRTFAMTIKRRSLIIGWFHGPQGWTIAKGARDSIRLFGAILHLA